MRIGERVQVQTESHGSMTMTLGVWSLILQKVHVDLSQQAAGLWTVGGVGRLSILDVNDHADPIT